MEIIVAKKKRSKKWLYQLGIVLGIIALLVLLFFFSLPGLLIQSSDTKPAEAILYFSVRNGYETDAYVADLYRQGYSKQIVCLSEQLTWQVYPADIARERLITLGLPATNISVLHLPHADCGADVLPTLLNFIHEQKWKSVLLVISPPTSRATQRAFAPQFVKEKIEMAITYAPSELASFQRQWWLAHKPTQMLVQQGIETVLDLLYPHCW